MSSKITHINLLLQSYLPFSFLESDFSNKISAIFDICLPDNLQSHLFKILINSQLLSCHLIGSKVMKAGLCNLQLALKYFIFYARCELHRPAFMTLEPIRWHCKFCWELRNDEYVFIFKSKHWLFFVWIRQECLQFQCCQI